MRVHSQVLDVPQSWPSQRGSSISEEHSNPICIVVVAGLTEVVLPYERWDSIAAVTGTSATIPCTNERPDVLPGPRNSMCNADTIEVGAVYV